MHRNFYALTKTACVFCGQEAGKTEAVCGDGSQHCIFCHRSEKDEGECFAAGGHIWRRGHDVQRIKA